MTFSNLLTALKGGAGSGHHGHAGIPGKVGGSAASATLVAGLVPGLPAGTYPVVYDASLKKTYSAQRAVLAAAKLGAGHVAVIVNGNHYVINTGDPSIMPVLGVYGDKPIKMTPYLSAHAAIQALGASTPIAPTPAKVYASKTEELYDKASPVAQEIARKYGVLATDANAEKYLQDIIAGDSSRNVSPLGDRNATFQATKQLDINKQYLNAAVDGKIHAGKSNARAVAATDPAYKVKRLTDPLGRGDDGYAVVNKKFKPTELPPPDLSKPDYNTMSALRSLSAAEVAKHQSHMDKNWNHYDNGGIKAKILNAFEITQPAELHEQYQRMKTKYGNTKFLYHGTSVAGAAGITQSGHFIGDVPKIGRIYGNGIYMADQESKSVQYAHEGSGYKTSTSRGVIFISQVAMGKVVKQDSLTGASGGSGYDLKPGVDTFIKTSSSYGGSDPFKSTTFSNEYIVRDPRAIQPRIWLDIERNIR